MTPRAVIDGWQGKSVSPEQAAMIRQAVREACAFETKGIFHRDLTEGCASVGWGPFDPMTLWTIAIYADVFPVSYSPREIEAFEGPLIFAGAGFALEHSKVGLFWKDRDLVNLAKKHAQWEPIRPSGQRSGIRPYRGW